MKRLIVRLFKLFLLLIVAVCGYAGFSSSHYRIERTHTILAPATSVWPCVNDLSMWEQWSPWRAHDSTVVNTYEGPASGTGAVMKWTSEHSGSGSVKIEDVLPQAYVRYVIYFVDWNSSAHGEFVFRSEGADTKLTWAMEGDRSFLERLVWTVFQVEKAIGKDFEYGLERMDQICVTQGRIA